MISLWNWLFPKKQRVLLVLVSNDMPIHTAYQLGGRWYADPHLPETRTELLPGGKVWGQIYVHGWRPVTQEMVEFFNTKSRPEEAHE